MTTVNIHTAKTHLSRLIQRARDGEDLVIAHAGTPVVRLVRVDDDRPRLAAPGAMAGRIVVAPDFDDSLDDDFDVLGGTRP